MKHLGITAKRFADPLIHATAPHGQANIEFTNSKTGEKETLTPAQGVLRMLGDRISDDAIVTGPEKDGYFIKAITSQSNFDSYVNAINALNTWIFRAFLIPSLVLTDGTAGSRSLGDKHFQIVDRICEAEALKFGETLINDLVERAVFENFGPMKNYGHFKPRPQNLEERIKMASMFSELIISGVMKTFVKEDMEFMREALGLEPDMDPGFDIGGDDLDESAKDPKIVPAPKDKPEPPTEE